jgi:hypothetical protein
MVDKSSVYKPIDEKHAERLLEAAKRAAGVLKEKPPPDTFASRRKDETDD